MTHLRPAPASGPAKKALGHRGLLSLTRRVAALLAALSLPALVLGGCAWLSVADGLDAQATQMMRQSFHAEGPAGMDRIEQDAFNAACSQAAGQPLASADDERLRAQAIQSIRQPSDGVFLGDWREGERIAQSGRGLTWTDRTSDPAANGGGCYNCHRISPAELSYGTLGPSLYHYGRDRSVIDPASPQAGPVVQYTWAKLWNAKAFNACSAMPRFGAKGLLDERQIKHLMALLLDPDSPVNRDLP